MDKQLQLCRDLFSAVLSCQEGCNVPPSFNSELLDALQRLMLEAVGGKAACISLGSLLYHLQQAAVGWCI